MVANFPQGISRLNCEKRLSKKTAFTDLPAHWLSAQFRSGKWQGAPESERLRTTTSAGSGCPVGPASVSGPSWCTGTVQSLALFDHGCSCPPPIAFAHDHLANRRVRSATTWQATDRVVRIWDFADSTLAGVALHLRKSSAREPSVWPGVVGREEKPPLSFPHPPRHARALLTCLADSDQNGLPCCCGICSPEISSPRLSAADKIPWRVDTSCSCMCPYLWEQSGRHCRGRISLTGPSLKESRRNVTIRQPVGSIGSLWNEGLYQEICYDNVINLQRLKDISFHALQTGLRLNGIFIHTSMPNKKQPVVLHLCSVWTRLVFWQAK